jgi:hypothetical protein
VFAELAFILRTVSAGEITSEMMLRLPPSSDKCTLDPIRYQLGDEYGDGVFASAADTHSIGSPHEEAVPSDALLVLGAATGFASEAQAICPKLEATDQVEHAHRDGTTDDRAETAMEHCGAAQEKIGEEDKKAEVTVNLNGCCYPIVGEACKRLGWKVATHEDRWTLRWLDRYCLGQTLRDMRLVRQDVISLPVQTVVVVFISTQI